MIQTVLFSLCILLIVAIVSALIGWLNDGFTALRPRAIRRGAKGGIVTWMDAGSSGGSSGLDLDGGRHHGGDFGGGGGSGHW